MTLTNSEMLELIDLKFILDRLVDLPGPILSALTAKSEVIGLLERYRYISSKNTWKAPDPSEEGSAYSKGIW